MIICDNALYAGKEMTDTVGALFTGVTDINLVSPVVVNCRYLIDIHYD